MATIKRQKADGTWEYLQQAGRDVEDLAQKALNADKKVGEFASQLAQTMTHITNKISINKFPRLAVETTDNGRFQRTVDYILSQVNTSGGFAIVLNAENYVINSTVFINKGTLNRIPPIAIIGQLPNPRGDHGLSTKYGSSLTSTVDNTIMFKTNLDELGNATEIQNQYVGLSVMNVSIRTENTGVVGFNLFRTRSLFENIHSVGLDYLIKQDKFDATGVNANYCDMSIYHNIHIGKSRKHGLKLCYADSSVIESVYFERPYSTSECCIEIENGFGIRISSVLSSMNNDVVKTTDNSIIKLKEVVASSLSGIYVERTNHKHMFTLDKCIGIDIKNIAEKFNGNTTFKLIDTKNTNIDGVYFMSDKNNGEFDVETDSLTIDFSIKNIRLVGSNGANRRFLSFRNGIIPKRATGKKVTLRIHFDGSNWNVVNINNEDVSSIVGSIIWEGDGLNFPSGSPLKNHQGVTISPRYINSTTIPFLPLMNSNGTKKIHFMNTATSTRVDVPSNRMDFDGVFDLFI